MFGIGKMNSETGSVSFIVDLFAKTHNGLRGQRQFYRAYSSLPLYCFSQTETQSVFWYSGNRRATFSKHFGLGAQTNSLEICEPRE